MFDEFQRAQMLTELQEETSIVDTRKQLNEIVKVFKSLDTYEEDLSIFASPAWRDLDINTLKEMDAFFIREGTTIKVLPEELRHTSLGFVTLDGKYLVYEGRFVYPIKDVRGDVAGFVGYDKGVEPKYLDSKNHGYKAKTGTVTHMDKLGDAYRGEGPVVFTEGIVCATWLRSQGVHAFALLGVYTPRYTMNLMRRFGKRALVCYDNDQAGSNAYKRLHAVYPDIITIQPLLAKDIDDMRRAYPNKQEEMIHDLNELIINPLYKSDYFKMRY